MERVLHVESLEDWAMMCRDSGKVPLRTFGRAFNVNVVR
jgi:hypothetical protein